MKKSLKPKAAFTIFLVSTTLMIGFQNCSNTTHFSSTPADLGMADLNSTAPVETVVVDPILDNTSNVICDPFSTGSNCSRQTTTGAGLIGNIYSLEAAQFNGDRNSAILNDYYNFGTKIETPIVLSELNIANRTFSDGFATGLDSAGLPVLLKDSQGNTLMEYFALKLSGDIMTDASTEGTYQFALNSDDGSSLSIDGISFILNDGVHNMRRKESTLSVELQRNIKHSISVGYFQGPKFSIGLQLYWRKCAAFSANNVCSGYSAWSIVPQSVLSH